MNSEIKAVLAAMPVDRRRSRLATGIATLVVCGTLYGLTLWGVFATGAWLSALLAVLNGVTIAMLFIVGHDACHGSLTPSRTANRVIGRIAFLPSLHPFSGWAKSHNHRHHGFTNLKGTDPGYAPFSYEEFCRLPWLRRQMERVYRTLPGLALFYAIEVWWKSQVAPPKDQRPPNDLEFRSDRVLVGSFFVAQVAGYVGLAHLFGSTNPWLFAAYAIAVPLAMFHWSVGFITYQHHTHPEIPWFDDPAEWSFFQGHVAGTTHIRFSWLTELVLMNIAEHSAHHVDPLIPLNRLQECQRALEAKYPDDVHAFRWNPMAFWKTLRQCKLYDYRNHQWLDFHGHPSTPALVLRRNRQSTVPIAKAS